MLTRLREALQVLCPINTELATVSHSQWPLVSAMKFIVVTNPKAPALIADDVIEATTWDTVPVLGAKTHMNRTTVSTDTNGFTQTLLITMKENSHGIEPIPIIP